MTALKQGQILRWYLIILSLGLIEGLVGTFFPLVFVAKGGSLIQLAIMTSLVSLAGILQTVWGRLLDNYRRPKLLGTSSLLINSGTLATMGLTNNPTVFGSARIANGLTTSGFNNSTAYLRSAYFPSSSRGKIGNFFMGFNLTGVALGVFIGGLLYDWLGYGFADVLHIIAAMLSVLSFILLILSLPEFSEELIQDEQLRFAMVEQTADLHYGIADTIALMRRSTGLISFIVATMIFHFAVGISGPFFVIELNQGWHLNTLEIGLITTFNAVVQVFMIMIFTPVVDIVNRKVSFTIGMFLAILPVVALVLDPAVVLPYFGTSFYFWMVVHFVSSLGWGLVNSLLLTLLIDYVHPKIRGTVVGLYGSIQSIIVFASSLLAALLISLLGTTELIFFLSIIGRALGLIILLFTASPPVPSSDFYEKRRIFLTRVYATVERGIVWLPVVGSILERRHNKS